MQLFFDDTLFYEGLFDSSYKFPDTVITEKRTVEYYELEFFTDVGGVTYLDGVSHPLRPGLFICAKPGCIRYTELPLSCYYVKIKPQLHNICAILDTLPLFAHIGSTERCVTLIHEMLSAGIVGDSLLRIAKFTELLSIVSTECAQYSNLHSLKQKRSRTAIEEALAYIESNYTGKISLDDIAAYVHFSPIYFHHIFKEAIGKTPYEYLTALRIGNAKQLLLTKQYDIADIVALCGFSSQSYFNYVFKRETGLTPSMYKKQNLEKYSF